jgi:hypothetical protein
LVAYTLPHLLRLSPTEHKKHLLALALKIPHKLVRKRLAYGILRSAASRQQLFALLTPAKARMLAECGSRKLTEVVAKVLVLRALEPLTVPASMWEDAFKHKTLENRRTARSQARLLWSESQKGLLALEKLNYLTHKPRSDAESIAPIPARPLHDARMTLTSISKKAEGLLTSRCPSYPKLRQFVNAASRRLLFERTDGICLLQSHNLPNQDLWTPNLIQRFTAAWQLIPEAERLMTPGLRGFLLSKMTTNNIGERRRSGRIAIDYPGACLLQRDHRYQDAPGLAVVLLHEVGHSIQFGRLFFTKWNRQSGEVIAPNDPVIDLKGFLEISGWRAVKECSPSDWVTGEAIIINETVFPLNRPINIALPLSPSQPMLSSRETVILTHGWHNMFYCHRPDAKFSLCSSSTEDPFEDWAEAFTEYLLCPDQLITLAPEKFHYMEIHFRHYRLKRDYSRLAAAQRALHMEAAQSQTTVTQNSQ